MVSVVTVRRQRQHQSLYQPLHSVGGGDYEPQPRTAASVAPITAPMAGGLVMATLLENVVANPSSSVLGCGKGEMVTVEQADWASDSEWMWVTKRDETGYIPRAYARRVQ